MGKIKQGILGGFNGKVGAVIGSSWRGKSVMRGIAQSIKNPKTPKQVAQRNFFACVNGIASQFSEEQLRTFFPNPVKGMTSRNLLVKQLSAACTVTDDEKAFDATLIESLGNASGIHDFGPVTVSPSVVDGALEGLNVSMAYTSAEVCDNYGAFIVFDVTKGSVTCCNSTSKMNEANFIAAQSGWEAGDQFKVLPYIYDASLPVVGFGSFIIKTRPAKTSRGSNS